MISTEFLEDMLSTHPAGSLDLYITSATMDVRRAMQRQSANVEEKVLWNQVRTLPPWVPKDKSLPPWEAQLISEMFGRRPVVVVQGGAGSGKTSARTFLQLFCKDLVADSSADVESLQHAILSVDLQTEAQALKERVKNEKERLIQEELFLTNFASKLNFLIQHNVPSSLISWAFKKSFLDVESDGNITASKAVALEVTENFLAKNPEILGKDGEVDESAISWAKIKSCLGETLKTGHEQIIARYRLLHILGELVWSEHQRPLVLSIDNIDPFPEYLQQRLIRTFESNAYTSTSSRNPSKFNIVLFARLSTTTQNDGALDSVGAKFVSFHAPDPADLVFYRVSEFLVAPYTFDSFKSLDPEVQINNLSRVSAFWEHLVDTRGGLSSLLSGLAGSNGRTAHKLATEWIKSPRLDRVSMELPREQGLKRAIALAVLARIARSFGRSIQVISEENCARQLNVSRQELLAEVLIKTGECLATLLENYGVFETPSGTNNGPRRRIHHSINKIMIELVNSSRETDLVDAAGESIFNEIYLAKERVVAIDGESTIFTSLTETVERYVANRSKDLESKSEIERSLLAWIGRMILIGNRYNSEARVNSGFSRFIHAELFNQAPRAVLRPTRWQAASILVSPSREYGKSEFGAVNIFSANFERICPVALHTLCILQELDGGISPRVITEHLKEWGFKKQQRYDGFREMVRVDNRLIYSRVQDLRDGLDAWLSDPFNKLQISSAGSSYLSSVVSIPAYLQWSLLSIKSIRAKLGANQLRDNEGSALGRLKLVLEALKLVREDEIERSEKIAKLNTRDLRKAYSPLAWVYLGSVQRFVIDIYGILNVGFSDRQKLAYEYMKFGARLIGDIRGRFESAPIVFEEQWSHASVQYTALFKLDLDINPYDM